MKEIDIYSPNEISFVAGSTEFILLHVYGFQEMKLNSINITKIEWKLAKYGENECLILKTLSNGITVNGDCIFVKLIPSDTSNFYGLYTHQITITDVNNNVFVINQGRIFIDSLIS